MLKPNQIFIHIPKTGGTTLNCLFFGENTPIHPNFNYRHIVYDTKMSNCGDIFNPMKNDKYIDAQIFMMLRHPVDRIISEYYFLKERSEFFDLLKPIPKSFKDYLNNKQTFNYNISFLLGKRIYSHEPVTKEDFRQVINSIEKLDIKIGMNEYFADSLCYFSDCLGFKVPKTVQSKRITLKRPKAEDISKTLYNQILENNSLDFDLYNYSLEKFNALKLNNKNNIQFEGDKYDYALVFANRFSLFEIELSNKKFIQINKLFFTELKNALNKMNIKDSKVFVALYVNETLKALKDKYPKFDFNSLDKKMINKEPLEKLSLLAKVIEQNDILHTKPMVFLMDNMDKPNQQLNLLSKIKFFFK